jgi:hypothetical protein
MKGRCGDLDGGRGKGACLGERAPAALRSSTRLRLPQQMPKLTPTRDSSVVRSLLAARRVPPKRDGHVRAW